jgi:hypothetical protein
VRRILIGVALLLAACQQGPAPQAPKANALSPVERLRAEGDALLAKADYVNAIEKYHQVVDLDPAAIGPRFALGTAYSFLDKRPEAIVQFRWVMGNAAADSTEYEEARRWLTRVGALATTPAVVADAAQRSTASAGDPTTSGRLAGRTEWPGVTPKIKLITGMLSLTGDEPVTQDVKRTRQFRLGDAYEFKDVPAGRYRLAAVIDGTTMWDEKITVEAGKDTGLTLSQATSPVPASMFSPPATASAESSPSPDAPRPR